MVIFTYFFWTVLPNFLTIFQVTFEKGDKIYILFSLWEEEISDRWWPDMLLFCCCCCLNQYSNLLVFYGVWPLATMCEFSRTTQTRWVWLVNKLLNMIIVNSEYVKPLMTFWKLRYSLSVCIWFFSSFVFFSFSLAIQFRIYKCTIKFITISHFTVWWSFYLPDFYVWGISIYLCPCVLHWVHQPASLIKSTHDWWYRYKIVSLFLLY